LIQALVERSQEVRKSFARSRVEEPDHRLLRVCRKRPRGRAAEQRDECTPPHSITSSVLLDRSSRNQSHQSGGRHRCGACSTQAQELVDVFRRFT